MKRNFFRKVAFGIGPTQEVPINPIDWSQAQVENVPKISWRKPLPTESELLKLRAQNQKSIVKARKKFRENPQALEAAYSEAYDKAGYAYHEQLELNVRHHAALNSEAPVFERFWWFWCNHFCTLEGMPDGALTGEYHRNIIRINLCNKFTDLVTAVTTSYAMIKSLDNSTSIAPNSERGKSAKRNGETVSINENHARELMELHTIAPAGGYTQEDVVELSYIMAGWEIPWSKNGWANPVKFNQKKHEPGEHTVLGKSYKQRGLSAKNKLLDVIVDLTNHPKCAEFLAYKLCKHFICDHPTQSMTQPIIAAWVASDGHLPTVHKAVLEVVYEHAERYEKFINPEVWVAQTANIFGLEWPRANESMDFSPGQGAHKGQPHGGSEAQREVDMILSEVGLHPYKIKQPNGWPDTEIEWISPELILRRFNALRRMQFYPRKSGINLNELIDKNYDNSKEINVLLKQFVVDDNSADPVFTQVLGILQTSKWGLTA